MANDRITGTLIEIFKVAGYGGSETETLVATTKDDIELAFNPVVAKSQAHNETRSQSRGISDEVSVALNGLVTTGHAALYTLGLQDASGNPATMNGFGTVALEAVRIKAYARKGDVSPAMKYDLVNVEVTLDSVKFPQTDFAVWSGTLYVNGLVKKTAGT